MNVDHRRARGFFRSGRVTQALAAALALAAIVLPLAYTDPAAAQASAITYVGQTAISPRLQELTLRTAAVIAPNLPPPLPSNTTGETKVRVLLPEGYDPNGTTRYPVLYLLHGGNEDFTAWTRPDKGGKAEELTADLPLIVVMPDCGRIGGYANWYNDGAFGTPQWRTYHLDQLVPWIDEHFHTIPNRAARAIAGLSMGGNGTISYAGHRPDLFGVIAPFSGSVDLTQVTALQQGPGADLGRLTWGAFPEQQVRWRADSGPDLAMNYANTDVSLYTGDTGNPEATFILGGTNTLHERFNALKLAHRYVLYPGMSHAWPTWNKALADWLPHLMAKFAGARASTPTPTSFSYTTIEANYTMYDWSVAVQRPAVEFSALEVADPRDFRVIGSGSATVRSPALGNPGQAFKAVITKAGARGNTVTLTADAEGRLSIPLDLGPGNRFLQYSAEADAAATGPSTDKTPFRLANNGSRFFRVDVKLTPSSK